MVAQRPVPADPARRTRAPCSTASRSRCRRPGSASQAPALREGQVGASRSVVATPTSLGTKDEPTLALILLPHDGDGEPAWVFPFNKPDAPDAEDDNQAMAVNTKDGSSLYDVAFALVWADGDDAQQRNEAYAFASCTACRTVAVGFQVVLIVGQANVVVPENIAAAVNYECVLCVTYALAKQLVLTLPDALSPDAMADLNEVWAQLLAFGERIEDVPLSQIQTELNKFAHAIKAIVEREAGSRRARATATAGPAILGQDRTPARPRVRAARARPGRAPGPIRAASRPPVRRPNLSRHDDHRADRRLDRRRAAGVDHRHPDQMARDLATDRR